MPRSASPHRWFLIVAAAVALGLTASVTAGPLVAPAVAAPAAGRVETPLSTRSPATDVLVSQVTIDAPLPAGAAAHPAACDKLSYLRFRSRQGPSSSAAAARIMLAQPGGNAGASSLAEIGRRTIQDAAARGSFIEFWALDRRANCLEDNTGHTAAAAAGDPSTAFDYYTRGKTIGGRRFAGYVPESRLGWLIDQGMQQTVNDEYTVLSREVPDQATRKAKVWCGGHSLGGVVTGFFAISDFDGNPATKADAGYNQCAGYFALDTQIATTPAGGDALPAPPEMPALVKAGHDAVRAAFQLGILPRSQNLPVLNPETNNLLALAGDYAALRPDALSTLATDLRGNDNVGLALRFLVSKDAGAFLTGTPAVSDFRLTNEAALGALMDDNSMPIAVLQESVGFFKGGPIADKTFPTGNDAAANPDLGVSPIALGIEKKAIPTDAGPLWARGTGPVYTWQNFDRIDTPSDPRYKAADGKPFTTAAKEVTDIRDLARGLSEFPLNFTEHYFPLSMLTDTQLWAAGDRTVVPSAIHPEGLRANPTINLWGGDGLVLPQYTKAGKALPPNTIVLPGYQHLDVLTAAAVQNDGSREKGAAALASFVLEH